MGQEFKINTINILKDKMKNGSSLKEEREYEIPSRGQIELNYYKIIAFSWKHKKY